MTPQTLFADASKRFRAGRYTEALALLNELLDHTRDTKTYVLLAKTLLAVGLKEQAAQTYALAGEQGGSRAEDYYAEAMKLYCSIGKHDLALSLGLPLVKKAQKDAELAYIIAGLLKMREDRENIRIFLPVLLESNNIAHNNLAISFLTSNPENHDNRRTLTELLARMPKNPMVLSAHLAAQREVNGYAEAERLQPQLRRILKTNLDSFLHAESQFYNLMWLADETVNKRVGYYPKAIPAQARQKRMAQPHEWAAKIRVGYLSSDFAPLHATMKLFAAVLAAHDPERVDVTLFCHTDPANLAADTRRDNWGRIVSIRDLSDEQAAATIRAHNIDVLVDMKGHTRGGRTVILNHGAAPVQVAWLGFPGTTVNMDIDYIIGDHSVLPTTSRPHYWEKFCRLPESYQPNNPHQPLARRDLFTRADAALAEDAFVFGSFNATRKISLETIELWTRILKATPESVIWIMVHHAEAEANIIQKLISGGIDRHRIVFTKKVPYEQHLARITLADVGLDPFPCNGHTTTSEQLWAGVPVLTKKGTHFASRVTESLLRAIDLPEMIAEDEDDYVRRAVELYENRDLLASYAQRLETNRFVKPLFDAERFCRHLETAYEMMVARAKQGLAPDHIDVPKLPPRFGSFA